MNTALKTLVTFALLAILAFTFSAADAAGGKAQKKKKKGDVQLKGTVVAVDDQGGGKATLTVKVQPKKKKNDTTVPEAKEEKIKINDKTKIEIAGKKKESTPGTLADLKTGETLTLTVRDNHAEKVLVEQKKKKKKN